MSAGGPDLFVICKSCGSEVSPYITECPYCGNRLRKRAPKLDRDGRPQEKPRRSRRRPAPKLRPLRTGELSGVGADGRPYATLAIVVASLVLLVLLRAGAVAYVDLVIAGVPLEDRWWPLLTAPFTYESSGYAFVALFAIAVFGWLLERRHGPLVVAALFLLAGAGGMAVASVAESFPHAAGGNGVALALVAVWAVPDLLDARRGRAIDGDLIGAATFAAVLLALPLAVEGANPLAGVTGLLVGLLLGRVLAGRRGG